MTLIALAIVSSNRVLGDGHDQPFKFKTDAERFKRVTLGHPMIMGRRTHDVMGLLPGRVSIVISRHPEKIEFPVDADGKPRGYAVDSFVKAQELALSLDEIVYVIGGGEIYRESWPYLDKLDVSEVHQEAEGSVTFPEIDPDEWVEVSRDPQGEFDFVIYERRRRA